MRKNFKEIDKEICEKNKKLDDNETVDINIKIDNESQVVSSIVMTKMTS